MIKYFRHLIIALCLAQAAFAQSAAYNFEQEISYYSSTGDSYRDSICRLDVYTPKDKKGFTTVIWFHGGGMVGGKKEFPHELKEKGFAVVSVGYRLNPKVNAPVYIQDAAAAIAWVFKHIESYGGDEDKIILSGHSAGGYLALMNGLDPRWLAAEGIDNKELLALMPLSPQVITHFTIRRERGISELQPIVDSYAPIYYVTKDAPPLYLVTGDRELELYGRYEENAYMARMMKLNGHKQTYLYELQGFNHGTMVPPGCYLIADLIAKVYK